jgi:heat shock protein HtpX
MAHEMAHVKHRDILITSVAVTIGGAISMLSQMFFFGGGRSRDGGGGAIEALGMLVLGPLAAAIIQSAISRSREFNADSGGAELVEDPMALATALEKIHHANRRIPMDVNPALNSLFIAEPTNVFRAAGNLFSTHPPIEKRLMNLIGRESTGLV